MKEKKKKKKTSISTSIDIFYAQNKYINIFSSDPSNAGKMTNNMVNFIITPTIFFLYYILKKQMMIYICERPIPAKWYVVGALV